MKTADIKTILEKFSFGPLDNYGMVISSDSIPRIARKIKQLEKLDAAQRSENDRLTDDEIETQSKIAFPFEKVTSTNTYSDAYNFPKRHGFCIGAKWARDRQSSATDKAEPIQGESAEKWFDNNSDCYADTGRFENDGSYTEGEVIPAITKETFLKFTQYSPDKLIIEKMGQLIEHLKAYDTLWEADEFKTWLYKKRKLERELQQLKQI